MSLQIWVPGSADVGDRTVAVDFDRTVADRCRICQEFVRYEDEPEAVMALHVGRCVKAHEAELREERERQHPEIMKPWDPEFAAWVKQHRDALLEGRKRA